MPAEKGDIRNLTNTTDVVERDPAWSPDGKSIAYFSDESGEYALHIRDQSGLGEVRKIDLGNPPTFYYSPGWSPDSQENRLHRQAAELLVRGPREENAGARGYGHVHRPGQSSPDGLVARQPLDRLHQAAAQPPARRLCLFAGARPRATS